MSNKLKNSKKYRESEKGRVVNKEEVLRNGSKRTLKYFYSEKGYSTYLKRVFNVEYKDWITMSRIAKNKCVLCGFKGERRLCIDHDHKTGKFRGLLCESCNKGLGHFKDNPLLLERALIYLNLHKEHKELIVPIFN